MLRRLSALVAFGMFMFPAILAGRILEVGPTHALTLPSQAAAIASDGDTVFIAAGEYVDAARWSADNLLIRGVGGYAHVRDRTWGGKAIWVIQGNNTTVEWVEFSGARVQDRNGAGIRQEGRHLTLRHCSFHHNEMGILAGNDTGSHILFEYCIFANNGYGDGYSHNVYINHVGRFTMRFCYSHDAVIGHNVKSRAHETWLLYNRFDEADGGNTSREIDIPNGGLAVIVGNTLDHGVNTDNSNLLGFGHEGYSNPRRSLYVVNNTFVTARSAGGFVTLPSAAAADTVLLYNNIFAGRATPLVGAASRVDSAANIAARDLAAPGFRNSDEGDFTLLSSSPAIGAGTDPGSVDGFGLLPVYEYVHPAGRAPRVHRNGIDCGAFAYQPPLTAHPPPHAAATTLRITSIAPNPVRDMAQITVALSRAASLRLLVTDLHGRCVIPARSLTRSAGEHTLPLDVRALPPGLHFLVIESSRERAISPLLVR
ncbi:MAG: right-handed parallel beta-helix repeat-containing protein [Bacteroidetes bacterium]|nr:right-handed parallel beta-helix repeat-containing protein [Bacteroidota bacterium]